MEEKNDDLKQVGPTGTKPHSTTHSRLINLDATWSLHLHTICAPIPRSLLKALEISGDGRFWFPIPIAVFLSPLSTRSDHVRRIVLGLLIGSLLDLLLVGLIKYAIKRPRPVYNKGMHLTVSVDHWSFPSGHSSRVCFVASFLWGSLNSIDAALVQLRGFGGDVWWWRDHWCGTLAHFASHPGGDMKGLASLPTPVLCVGTLANFSSHPGDDVKHTLAHFSLHPGSNAARR